MRADFVVKFVIILLIASSIFSWALIFDKFKLFKAINKSTEDFEKNDHASLLIKERRITNKKVTSVIYNYYLREDFIIGDW